MELKIGLIRRIISLIYRVKATIDWERKIGDAAHFLCFIPCLGRYRFL